MSTHRLDADALWLALQSRVDAERLSYRDVAARTGVSASLLTKLKRGGKPDADNLVSLLVWLGRGVEDFTVPNDAAPG